MAASNMNVVVITGNLTRDPELRSTPAAGPRSASCGSPSTAAARTARPANGSTSPTTSTSPSGARRARTAPTTSRRAARSRSKAGSTGASGRPKTAAANGRRSRSSPTRSSSSARATAPAAAGGNGGGFTPSSDVPADTSDFEGAAAGAAAAAGTTTSRSSRGRRSALIRRRRPLCSIPRPHGYEQERQFDETASTAPRRGAARTARARANTRGSTSEAVDYKDLNLLRRFLSDKGKTRGRRVTGPLAQAPAPALGGGEAGARDRPAALRRRALMAAGDPARGRRAASASAASRSTSPPATCATT